MTEVLDTGPDMRPAGPSVSDWEDPPRLARQDGAPILSVDGFSGPLDWLLEMVRARKIDLFKLSIAALIEAFVNAMAAALADRATEHAREGSSQIAHWAVWTVMAATLTELWSRLMLPADSAAARGAAAEAEALRQRLVGHAEMGAAADWLEQRAQLGRDAFRRGRPEITAASRGGGLTDLLRACLVALHVPDEQVAAARPRPPPLWTANSAAGGCHLYFARGVTVLTCADTACKPR